MSRVNQLLAGYADGDAISEEARSLRDIFRRNGYSSEIYAPADSIAEAVRTDCMVLEDYSDSDSDVLLYHYSIASEANLIFLNSRARRVMRYHNITPAEFFEGFDDGQAAQLRKARSELSRIFSEAHKVWPVSGFNASEIESSGSEKIEVLPLVSSRLGFSGRNETDIINSKPTGDLRNILFVGRIAPNKCIEELIEMFAWIYGAIDNHSRLVIVGSERSCPKYYAMLRFYANRLGLQNVCFTGFVKDDELAEYYRSADVFVSASRHEGFCLPLLEAMVSKVPVVARLNGGMPEAMGEAGVLFDDLNPRRLGVLVYRLMTDDSLRKEILRAQSERLKRYYMDTSEEKIMRMLI